MLEEKELLADEEEDGDGVVGKELFIGTTPHSTKGFPFPCINSSELRIKLLLE